MVNLFYFGGMVASGQLLLEQGASLEVQDKAGRTPLLKAAQGGHANMIELLQVTVTVTPKMMLTKNMTLMF